MAAIHSPKITNMYLIIGNKRIPITPLEILVSGAASEAYLMFHCDEDITDLHVSLPMEISYDVGPEQFKMVFRSGHLRRIDDRYELTDRECVLIPRPPFQWAERCNHGKNH